MPIFKDEDPGVDCIHVAIGNGDVQTTFGVAREVSTGFPEIQSSFFGFINYKASQEEIGKVKNISSEAALHNVPPVVLHFAAIESIDELIGSLQVFKQHLIRAASVAIISRKPAQA